MRRTQRRVRANDSTRTHHDGCTTGLCKACGWDKKRIPRAWRTQRPGTPYPCKSKVIGRSVTLRGDSAPSEVVGCATPLGETIFQHGKRGQRYRCQGAFTVRSRVGRGAIETPVPKSVVNARIRHAKDVMCPDAPRYDSGMRGFTKATEREAHRGKRHPYDDVGEVPFPHRKGSTPCCANSPVNPARLDRLYDRYHESGEDADFEALANAVRRALPKHDRAITALETDRQVKAGIRAVRDKCWAQWVAKEDSLTRDTRRGFQSRVRASKREMGLLGLPLTAGRRSRSVTQEVADERAFLRRAKLASRNQFLRMTPDKQIALVTRTFKRAKRELSFPAGMLAGSEGEELLATAAREFHRGDTRRNGLSRVRTASRRRTATTTRRRSSR